MLNILRLSILVLSVLLFLPRNVNAQSQPPIPSNGKSSQPKQKQPQSLNQGTGQDQRGTEQSPIVIKVLPTPKTEAEAEQDRKQREEESALKHETMAIGRTQADSSLWQAVILFVQLIILGVQTFVLYKTFTNSQMQLRAYVFIEGVELKNISAGSPLDVKIRIRNYGSTPAYELTQHVNMAFGPVFVGGHIPATSGEPSRTNLAHNNYLDMFPTHEELTAEQLTDLQNGTTKLWVYGELHYRDIFKKPHTTTFRLVLVGENGAIRHGLGYCQEGNEEI